MNCSQCAFCRVLFCRDVPAVLVKEEPCCTVDMRRETWIFAVGESALLWQLNMGQGQHRDELAQENKAVVLKISPAFEQGSAVWLFETVYQLCPCLGSETYSCSGFQWIVVVVVTFVLSDRWTSHASVWKCISSLITSGWQTRREVEAENGDFVRSAEWKLPELNENCGELSSTNALRVSLL